MKLFSALRALCEGNPQVTGGFPKGLWSGALMFSLICACTNGWANLQTLKVGHTISNVDLEPCEMEVTDRTPLETAALCAKSQNDWQLGIKLWAMEIPRDLILTHWCRDKIAAIFQTFSNVFSWMKMLPLRLKFHWSLFRRTKLIIFQHWFR